MEVIDPDQGGVLVDSEDPLALARELDRLLADKTTARSLGERGRARLFEQRFTREAMLARYHAIYRDLARC